MDKRKEQARKDLSELCERVPVPSTAKRAKKGDVNIVSFSRAFKTTESCHEIRETFYNYFLNAGWDRNRMETEESRGGMTTTDFLFRDGDYLVWVSCENGVADEAMKKISVSCSWGLREW